jgi:DNA-binding XRE family transcriptional regulator
MIRQASTKDKVSIAIYLAQKLNISLPDANRKANKIIKSGLPAFMLEGKDLQGICWVEFKLVGEKKEKFVEILCNNWRLAESYIQVLRWELDGIYWFSLPKRDFLNRTLNKAGIRFVKVDGDKNVYNYKFEKRNFFNYKSEDNE